MQANIIKKTPRISFSLVSIQYRETKMINEKFFFFLLLLLFYLFL